MLQRLGRVLKDKAAGDFDRFVKGTSKTRERLGVGAWICMDLLYTYTGLAHALCVGTVASVFAADTRMLCCMQWNACAIAAKSIVQRSTWQHLRKYVHWHAMAWHGQHLAMVLCHVTGDLHWAPVC